MLIQMSCLLLFTVNRILFIILSSQIYMLYFLLYYVRVRVRVCQKQFYYLNVLGSQMRMSV